MKIMENMLSLAGIPCFYSISDDKQIDDFPKRFYNCIEQIDEFNLKSINKIN
jgi:hypothetical protein